MKINSIELSPLDLLAFKDLVKVLALEVISAHPQANERFSEAQMQIAKLCMKYRVDHTNDESRHAFIKTLLEFI
jgi:hypothetical protein